MKMVISLTVEIAIVTFGGYTSGESNYFSLSTIGG